MNSREAAQQLLDQPEAVTGVIAGFSASQRADLVRYLKEQVDANWWSDAQVSLAYANAIIAVGETSQHKGHHALGLMARGDTLRLLGELEAAWETLEQAAAMFMEADDEVGWARTCIGRLALCVDLHRVEETLENAFTARTLLEKHGETDKLIRLETGIAFVYLYQGRYAEALDIMIPTIELARSLGEAGKPRLRHLYQNVAFALMFLTRFAEAKTYYEAAQQIFEEAGDVKGIAATKTNIAYLSEKQGHFREALNNHHVAMESYTDSDSSNWAVSAQSAARCYIALNRYDDASRLIKQAEWIVREQKANNLLARTLETHAIIQAHANQYEASIQSLQEAAELFKKQGATERLPYLALRRAEIAYLHGLYDEALTFAFQSAQHFETGHYLYYCNALLVLAQIYYARSDWSQALESAQEIKKLARHYDFAPLRYQAHLLLGKIAQETNQIHRAIRHFQAANATINRLQQRLTMALRSDFLMDKSEAFRRLTDILLAQNKVANALEEIERHKSQVFWHYLLTQDRLRSISDSSDVQGLVEELDQHRSAHHWYYHLLNHPEDRGNQGLSDADLQTEIAQLEVRIRHLNEQRALQSERTMDFHLARLPDFEAIKKSLPDDAALIEYYIDGETILIFTLARGDLQVIQSQLASSDVRKKIEQFQFNVDSALSVGRQSPLSQQLNRIADKLLAQLYEALLASVADHITSLENLIIVPYGILHYVPFHLLRPEDDYLFATHAVNTLPSSSFLLREHHTNSGESLIIGYSRPDELPFVPEEARGVHERVGGRLVLNEDVTRETLSQESGLILHIAAHGEFRIDQPDLSFIELSDGQLMADDLLQFDMAYALVTLSACETGRSYVAPADELIGLGRAFLYNGASALLTSLWRTEDELTKDVIFAFYSHLSKGMDKAHALRRTYLDIQQHYPGEHAAFWGAFQLVGDPSPIF